MDGMDGGKSKPLPLSIFLASRLWCIRGTLMSANTHLKKTQFYNIITENRLIMVSIS